MVDQLTQVGVSGVVALLMLEKVFAFMGKRKNGGNGQVHLIGEMHRVLTAEDTDGAKRCWSRPRLETVIEELTGAVREMRDEQRRTREAVAALTRQITGK